MSEDQPDDDLCHYGKRRETHGSRKQRTRWNTQANSAGIEIGRDDQDQRNDDEPPCFDGQRAPVYPRQGTRVLAAVTAQVAEAAHPEQRLEDDQVGQQGKSEHYPGRGELGLQPGEVHELILAHDRLG